MPVRKLMARNSRELADAPGLLTADHAALRVQFELVEEIRKGLKRVGLTNRPRPGGKRYRFPVERTDPGSEEVRRRSRIIVKIRCTFQLKRPAAIFACQALHPQRRCDVPTRSSSWPKASCSTARPP